MKKLLAFLMLVTILGCGKEAEQEKVQENKEVSSNIEVEKEKIGEKQEEKYLNILEVSTVSSGKKSIEIRFCLLYTSPSPRDRTRSRMPSSA